MALYEIVFAVGAKEKDADAWVQGRAIEELSEHGRVDEDSLQVQILSQTVGGKKLKVAHVIGRVE